MGQPPALVCAQCGSTRLQPRRGSWAKFLLGPLAPRRLIECRDCHTIYNPRSPKKTVGRGV